MSIFDSAYFCLKENSMLSFFKDKKILEFIRFVIVGGTATIIHYAIYYILQLTNIKFNLAYTIGYGISFIFNFIASNYFTFKTEVSINRGAKFTVAHIINYLIQMLLLNIYINIGIPNNIAPIFVFMVAIPINFVMVRFALKGKVKKGNN